MNKAIVSIIFLVLQLTPKFILAQDNNLNIDRSEAELNLVYENSKGIKTLTAILSFEGDESTMPVINETIEFYYQMGEEITKISNQDTDNNGKAVLTLSSDLMKFMDEEGTIQWKAIFPGNDKFTSTELSLSIKDIVMEVSFGLIDSVKSIIANVYELTVDGDQLPVEELDVYFFTPSLFGLLPIGEGWVEGGECFIDFPTSLPGDESGNLIVIAKIMESEIYGDIISENTIDWAKIKDSDEFDTGKLWTSDPPLWMVIALFCLLGGVWSHYYFVFYKMVKIKKAGKKAE
ncbi:hypothetical protein ACFLTI_08915 [Bacteroidota bacterium]